jgi:hypothetical protein
MMVAMLTVLLGYTLLFCMGRGPQTLWGVFVLSAPDSMTMLWFVILTGQLLERTCW